MKTLRQVADELDLQYIDYVPGELLGQCLTVKPHYNDTVVIWPEGCNRCTFDAYNCHITPGKESIAKDILEAIDFVYAEFWEDYPQEYVEEVLVEAFARYHSYMGMITMAIPDLAEAIVDRETARISGGPAL